MNPELVFVRCIERRMLSEEPASVSSALEAAPVLALPFERRQIARQRVVLRDHGGRSFDAGLKLPRGTVLRAGDFVATADNRYARVDAAPEQVSLVRCDDAQALARAAYHLGNRHVWVQIGGHWLRYLHDHVLDEMLVGLGLTVVAELAPFEPEAGAYSTSGSHSHAH